MSGKQLRGCVEQTLTEGLLGVLIREVLTTT